MLSRHVTLLFPAIFITTANNCGRCDTLYFPSALGRSLSPGGVEDILTLRKPVYERDS